MNNSVYVCVKCNLSYTLVARVDMGAQEIETGPPP
jgi:hypothetical protein